ncbi:heat shock 70 kDa protein 15-like protein [Tanacetum coccineum]|uniref:Heat shock 70 kDa protein 15-like protein n=1 Tax=Tanacetum coccineum TaxID=301880 RepID=A0ABQ5I578_9ASTR
MSVVGFDLGNESCVVAVARQRGIDVVLNDESKRETPALVCFGDKQRFLGTAGAATIMSNPKNAISQIKRLIGRPFSDPELQQDLKSLPFSVTEGPDGFPLIHAQYLGEKRAFTPTQVMGMVFSNMKTIAEKNLNTAVVDCCIGIPIYFTDLQRRAVMDAATIAGLHPLRLMHETTATALAYGIYKTDLPENEQLNVAFVDIGHASMQVCIAGFKKGQLKVLAHSFDRCLGGRDFDEILFQHFVEKFKVEYKIDVLQNGRACLWLRAACEKLKKVLSANPEAPMNIECLMEDKDVRGFINRDEFEQISAPILERVKKPLEKALAEAQLTVGDIYAVEVVGSGSKVPAVIKILAEFFGKEPRRTMNASECVSKGCAMECAILSPTFKVREFQVQESFPFSIALTWKGAAQDSQNKTVENQHSIVFPKGNPIPSVKAHTFFRSGTFSVDLKYADVSELQAPPTISTYTIGPFQATNAERAKVKVKACLNLHGIVSVESAQLIEEEEVEVPVTKEPSKEATKMDTDNASADVPSTNETDVNMDDAPVTENGAVDTGDNAVKMETDTKVEASNCLRIAREEIEMEIKSEDKTSSNLGAFDILSQEITEQIFSNLHLLELAQMRSLSKGVNSIICSEEFQNVVNGSIDSLSGIVFFAHGKRVNEDIQFGDLWGVRDCLESREINIPLRPIIRNYVHEGEYITLLASYGILFLFKVSANDAKRCRLLLVNILSSTTTLIPKPDELDFFDKFEVCMVPFCPSSSVLGFRILHVQFSFFGNQPFLSSFNSRSRNWEVLSHLATPVPSNQPLHVNNRHAATFVHNGSLITILSFQGNNELVFQTHLPDQIFRKISQSHQLPAPFTGCAPVQMFNVGIISREFAAFLATSDSTEQGMEDFSHLQMVMLIRINPELNGYVFVGSVPPSFMDLDEIRYIHEVQVQQTAHFVNIAMVIYTGSSGWGIDHFRCDLRNQQNNWSRHETFYGDANSVYSLGLPFFNFTHHLEENTTIDDIVNGSYLIGLTGLVRAIKVLTKGRANAQGVAEISNGVSVLNLGRSSVANPSPAPAAAAASTSWCQCSRCSGVSVLNLVQSSVANLSPAPAAAASTSVRLQMLRRPAPAAPAAPVAPAAPAPLTTRDCQGVMRPCGGGEGWCNGFWLVVNSGRGGGKGTREMMNSKAGNGVSCLFDMNQVKPSRVLYVIARKVLVD